MNVTHLGIISFLVLTFPDFIWQCPSWNQAAKIRVIVHMSGYVAVKTDCKWLVVMLRNKSGKFDMFFFFFLLKTRKQSTAILQQNKLAPVHRETTVPRHHNELLVTSHKILTVRTITLSFYSKWEKWQKKWKCFYTKWDFFLFYLLYDEVFCLVTYYQWTKAQVDKSIFVFIIFFPWFKSACMSFDST